MDTTAAAAPAGGSGDTWSWAPYAPDDAERFRLDDWAPPTSVRRPWLRVGRFTLLYRRAA